MSWKSVVSIVSITSLAVPWGSAGDPSSRQARPEIRVTGRWFEVAGLDSADLNILRNSDLKATRWQRLFTVHVVGEKTAVETTGRPAVLGSVRIDRDVLRFEPNYPLMPGVRYRTVFRPAILRGQNAGSGEITAEFVLPKRKRPATVVTHVYPSRDQLPENQLKFYVHFSAAMSRGEAYRRIRLLDEAGKPVEMPFLELDEELWDPAGKRFTLFFDPGRIKRGLKPREEVGPALVEGKQYTLVIDAEWQDAEGTPLRGPHQKRFRIVAPDRSSPQPKDWKIEEPPAGTALPLTVRFPEPLDHALLQRLLSISNDREERIRGTVQVTDQETSWQFTPERPWKTGNYTLIVDSSLEDLAGNSVARPFEVDEFRAIQERLKNLIVERKFRIVCDRNRQ